MKKALALAVLLGMASAAHAVSNITINGSAQYVTSLGAGNATVTMTEQISGANLSWAMQMRFTSGPLSGATRSYIGRGIYSGNGAQQQLTASNGAVANIAISNSVSGTFMDNQSQLRVAFTGAFQCAMTMSMNDPAGRYAVTGPNGVGNVNATVSNQLTGSSNGWVIISAMQLTFTSGPLAGTTRRYTSSSATTTPFGAQESFMMNSNTAQAAIAASSSGSGGAYTSSDSLQLVDRSGGRNLSVSAVGTWQ